MKTQINKSEIFTTAWKIFKSGGFFTFGAALTEAWERVYWTEEKLEEEMDFGMFDVVSTPQTKLVTHKRSELFAVETEMNKFYQSL